MIVSGFTQRTAPPTDEDLAEFPGCHIHCFRCRNAKCTHSVDNVIACAMTTCQGCGLRFHECKGEEHTLTCQEERVPCINAAYGCPHIIKRSSLHSHLPVCPASVVCCGEEWSRWPMYTAEKGVRHPLPPTKTYIDCGQLDVSLAMRDQRMLIDSLKAPPKLRRILRNPLTRKYPAAPIAHRSPSLESDLVTSTDTSQTVSDDETDAPWDLSRHHPGLRDSIISRLFRVSKETTESLATTLNNPPNTLPQKCSPLTDISEKNEDAVPGSNSQEFTSTEFPTETPVEKDDGNDTEVRSLRNSVSADRDCERSRSRSVSVLHDVGGSQLHKILGVKLGDENEAEICLHKILGVSITHDCINKYVGKPASMYTFICAQNFRRDQYKWHFKNVHDDVISGLGGFLEHRCPLAYQGCTFSYQRLIPSQPNTELHFSWLQESFGLKSNIPSHLPSSSVRDGSSEVDFPSTTSRESSPQDYIVSNDRNRGNDNTAMNSNTSNTCSPSISDLAQFDKMFDQLKVSVPELEGDSVYSDQERLSSLSPTPNEEPHIKREEMVNVQPVVLTACNPDSKVLLVYNVEEDCDPNEMLSNCSLADMPFEVLQQIAQRLDSFSLFNLSLTCRLLRDVCCSLLDDHGIVLLNWERQKIGDKISWKVTSKRWIFSSSFEPITSWKVNDNHVTMTDHLKVCPFNQDKSTHTSFDKIILDY